ncbi:hypothetical protein [Azohydromonas sediminis]|uniref:hypothetical protein n=1 Tax=Azohydromonas sediminis TaxID=2259674 RepID=UPI0013C35D02|nr:hypothetical protein [Azohydromonas sediminis]
MSVPSRRRSALAALSLLVALSGCAHEMPPSPRLVLTVAVGAPQGDALRAAIAARAGVPVTVWAPVDARTVGLRLDCRGDACAAAIERLRADRALVADLRPDERQRVPQPPPPGTAR